MYQPAFAVYITLNINMNDLRSGIDTELKNVIVPELRSRGFKDGLNNPPPNGVAG